MGYLIASGFFAQSPGGGGSVFNPFNTGAKQELAGVGTSQATASASFNTNGSTTLTDTQWYDPEDDDINNGITNVNWFLPTTTSIGASYWLNVLTPSVGTFTSGTLNTRQQLSTLRQYTCTTTGSFTTRQKYVKAAFEIWDAASGGNKVCDGVMTLKAAVDNS